MDLQITVDATQEEARAELARWLDSGEFTQTRGALCRVSSDGVESYCCLGVASEIGAALGLVVKKYQDEHGQIFDTPVPEALGKYGEETGALSPKLQKFFGLSSTGFIKGARGVSESCELTGYNDRLKADFHAIAEVVRTSKFKTWDWLG